MSRPPTTHHPHHPFIPQLLRDTPSPAANRRTLATSLISALSLLVPSLLTSEPVNIAILAPSTGPLALVGEQTFKGAQISIQDLQSTFGPTTPIELHRIPAPFPSNLPPDSLDKWTEIRNQLTAKEVDFLIGGYTPDESAVIKAFADEWKIPTLLLTPIPVEPDAAPSALVLEMGNSWDQVYTHSVRDWADQNSLSKIAILFDFEDDTSYQYATDLTEQAFTDSGLEIAEIPFSRPNRPYYKFEIDELIKSRPDGVIVSGLPLDSANIVRRIGTHLGVPVYITTPSGWSNQFAVFAQGAQSLDADQATESLPSKIYFGSQIWSAPADGNIELATRLRAELGWSNGAISSHAIQAYDAIRVIETIWNNSGQAQAAAQNPWAFDLPISGNVGEFYIKDNRLVAPYHLNQMDSTSLSFVSP